MKARILLITVLLASPAVAQDERQSAQPGDPQSSRPSPYAELNKQVQEKLRAESFYNGPINGDFGYYTQAALAQFQLSRALPASGSLDATTLAALGLEQAAEGSPAAAGDSAAVEPQAGDQRRCDALMGQEKEHCLQRGGTLEASVQSGS